VIGADLADGLAETLIVPSFTRIGYDLRSLLDGWESLDEYDLAGRTIVLTGGTSGLGRAAAYRFAAAGATLLIVGRTADRNETIVSELQEASGNDSVSQFPADMGDLDEVRSLAAHILASFDCVDVLVHNAGALTPDRRTAPSGLEATVASQVVGPFLLTTLLLPALTESETPRVLTMSSGGMYSEPLTVGMLQMSADDYRGTAQYARAKRAQVTLNEMWAERHPDVTFHSLHPGWASTPGVDEALPGFARVMGPLLRTADQGADTLVWLAADDTVPLQSNGGFWLDRRRRGIHRLGRTRRTDTADRRDRLWTWVSGAAGLTT